MRILRILPLLVLPAVLACGGGEQSEPAADAQMAGVPAVPSCFLQGATLEEAMARPSPLRQVTFSVGGHEGSFCYGAPSANGRVVMGQLVPFGEPWRLGANEATAIHLTGPAQVGGVELAAGSYSLYAVPGETEWTFHLNGMVERWGIPIGEDVMAADVGTFTAPVQATDAPVEQLTFRFEASEDGTMGDMVMEWENTRVTFHLHPAGA